MEAATYNIGPGQTYKTFAALAAAHTLQPDDIVDGGGNTFTGTWTVNGSGTDGHPILIRNAIISGSDTLNYGIDTNSKSYITISNLTINSILFFSIKITGSSYINIDNLNISGKGTVYSSNSSFINITNSSSTNSDSSYSAPFYFVAPGTDLTISTTTISGSNKSGIHSTLTSNVTLNNVEVSSSTLNAITISGVTSGTITLTDIYSGIKRDKVTAGGNGNYGIYISGSNGAMLNASGIYSSNNNAANISIISSALTAGSILKNFITNNSITDDGIYLVSVSNLTIQNGISNYNRNSGLTAYGSATTNLVTEYVTASYNYNDGIDSATQNTPENCPRDWIVRYSEASYNGHNNGVDTASGDGFSIHNLCTANYYYVKSIGNLNTGMAHTGSSGGKIYNSILINNGSPSDPAKQTRSGLYLTTNANPGFTVRNNIVSGNYPAEFQETSGQNHNDLDYNLYYPNPTYNDNFYTAAADGTGYITWAAYHSTRETNSQNTNPQFMNLSDANFSLVSTSSAIDAGTMADWMTSTTTDFAGNPIYGTPDIGVYEYQPPYTITTENPQYSGNIRIYGDGKYRYTTATTTSTTANLKVTPAEGVYPTYQASTTRPEYMNISNITWGTSKQWTASSTIATTTIYTIGDLTPDTLYTVTIDGATSTAIASTSCSQGICTSGTDGKLILTYIGGYSTHTFAVTPDTTAPSVTLTSPAAGTIASTITLTATASDNVDVVGVQFILDSNTNIGSEITSTSSPNTYSTTWNSTSISDGSHTLSAVARDTSGNYATSTVSVNVLNTPPTSHSSSGSSGGGRAYVYIPPVVSTTTATSTSNCPMGLICKPIVISSYIFTKLLVVGNENTEVNQLQVLLYKLGYLKVSPTGYYGSLTEKAVKAYQIAHGIDTLGFVGPQTRLALNSEISTSTPSTLSTSTSTFNTDLSYGMTNSDVAKLQTILYTQNFLKISPTGYFGNLTLQAVKEYQKVHNINPTGYVGPLTRGKLNK